MHKLRRQSPRRNHCRAAKIQIGGDAPARDCLLIDISKGGVRLNVEGLDVPDEFVLFLSNDGIIQGSVARLLGVSAMKLVQSSLASVAPALSSGKSFPLKESVDADFVSTLPADNRLQWCAAYSSFPDIDRSGNFVRLSV